MLCLPRQQVHHLYALHPAQEGTIGFQSDTLPEGDSAGTMSLSSDRFAPNLLMLTPPCFTDLHVNTLLPTGLQGQETKTDHGKCRTKYTPGTTALSDSEFFETVFDWVTSNWMATSIEHNFRIHMRCIERPSNQQMRIPLVRLGSECIVRE